MSPAPPSPTAIGERDFYAPRGTLHEAGFFADQDEMYQGWAHLNRKGAKVMTHWLAEYIAPLLGEAPKQ
jgi:lysophospholipase L1-like esterase